MREQFISTNKLDFEVGKWEFDKNFKRFRVGTCEGLFSTNKEGCAILAVSNSKPHNGHFNDVLEWFEYSCKQHKVKFIILEVWNNRLKKHLIEQRGFIDIGNCYVEKSF